jgi:hypothetical protein
MAEPERPWWRRLDGLPPSALPGALMSPREVKASRAMLVLGIGGSVVVAVAPHSFTPLIVTVIFSVALFRLPAAQRQQVFGRDSSSRDDA